MTTEDMIPVNEFCAGHQLEISFVRSLEENGLIETTIINEMQCFEVSKLPRLEQIVRLHQELDINFEGIDAIHHLLAKIEDMHRQIIDLKNRLSFFEEVNE